MEERNDQKTKPPFDDVFLAQIRCQLTRAYVKGKNEGSNDEQK